MSHDGKVFTADEKILLLLEEFVALMGLDLIEMIFVVDCTN